MSRYIVQHILALVLLLAVVATCTVMFNGYMSVESPKRAKVNPHLIVLLPGKVDFFEVETIGIVKAADEYGLSVDIRYADWSAETQLKQVADAVAAKPDMICLCAADAEKLKDAARICAAADIPLMTFTNAIGPDPQGWLPGVLTHVGRNEEDSGRILGRMVLHLMGDDAARPVRIVLIQGAQGTAPQRLRERGFKEIASQHVNWKIVHSQCINGWSREAAATAVKEFCDAGGKTDIIVAQWGLGALAVVEGLTAANVSGVKVVGLELNKEMLPAIRDGRISYTTHFSVVEEGFLAIKAAARFCRGEYVEPFVAIRQQWVNAENVDECDLEF